MPTISSTSAVRDLIDREYARPLDVPAMARSAAMSPSHFARRYREAYGETPYQHLLTRRIERAKALLRADELTVTDVCVAVGFTSLGAFSWRFHELTGLTRPGTGPRSPSRGASRRAWRGAWPDRAGTKKRPELPRE
jgi:AraC-like DNA-binding protein